MVEKLKVLTFLYHETVDAPTDSGFQRKSALPYKHSTQEFRDNIDIIVKNSAQITTVDQLKNITDTRATLITFDDGGKSNLFSANHLENNNVKGHFFITTDLIGDPYFMSEEELVRLDEQGHIIGSHSHTHPNVFKSLSYPKMLEEWAKSKEILEKILRHPVDSCSIPGGDANYNAYRSAMECGFKYIFDSEPTVKIRKKGDTIILGRICPKTGTSLSKIDSLSKYKGIGRQKAIRELKKAIKTIIFPLYTTIRNSNKHKG